MHNEIFNVDSEENMYTVKAAASDSVVSLNDDLPILIADIPCTSPQVNIINAQQYLEFAPTNMRCLKLRMETSAQYQCNRTVTVT